MSFGGNQRQAVRPQALRRQEGRSFFSSPAFVHAGKLVKPAMGAFGSTPLMSGMLAEASSSKASLLFWHYYGVFDKVLTGYSLAHPEAEIVQMYWQMKLYLLSLVGLKSTFESLRGNGGRSTGIEWFNEFYSNLVDRDYSVKQKKHLDYLHSVLSDNLLGDLSDEEVAEVLEDEVQRGVIEDQTPYLKAYSSLKSIIDPTHVTQQIKLLGGDLLELLSRLMSSIQAAFSRIGSSYTLATNEEKILIGPSDDHEMKGLTDAL